MHDIETFKQNFTDQNWDSYL